MGWVVPFSALAAVASTAWLLPAASFDFMWGEGGALELTQAVLLLAGFILAIRLVRHPVVRETRHLTVIAWLAVVGLAYVFGEELSWGQHLFGWGTPEFFAELNDQDETGVHNMSALLDQLPRTLLEAGIVLGAIVAPLARRWGYREPDVLAPLLPHPLCTPTAVLVLLFHLPRLLWTAAGSPDPGTAFGVLPRVFLRFPGETQEWFIYYFALLYLMYLPRRLEMSRARAT